MAINPMYLGQAAQSAPAVPVDPSRAPTTPYDREQLGAPQAVRQTGPEAPDADSWRSQAAAYLRSAGADMTNIQVIAILDAFEAASEQLDSNPAIFNMMMSGAIQQLESQGLIVRTPYDEVRSVSGFGAGAPPSTFEAESAFDVAALQYVPPVAPSVSLVTQPGVPVTQPTTGWLQYPSGVLVDPNAPFGSVSAIYFPPNSEAPGSAGYFQRAQQWDESKVNEWREKLVDLGYLASNQKKGPYDVAFQAALQQYHVIKYQNGGKELPLEGKAAADAIAPFNFQQVSGQIRNDIRAQYQRIYGDDPTDSELAEWEDFIVTTAGRLYRRGQMAPSQATVEAEERAIERIEQSPEAQFVTQNLEENTGLRDSILRAVMVAQGMSG